MANIEDRLKRLKKAKDDALPEIQFTDQHKQNIRAVMQKEDLKHSILTLVHEPKSSSEIAQLLHAKNEQLIRHNEGAIFNLLHELELAGFVEANWQQHEQKTYVLTKKGLKILAGEKERAPLFSFNKLWQEVRGQ